MASNAMSNEKIASNFKKLRAQRKYSFEKVACLADLSLNTVIPIESGANKNLAINAFPRSAYALEVDVGDLIN